tara:strand:- start:859 stop:1059 length:201 start_codon:yes stop_codon:yes gene_type:complete
VTRRISHAITVLIALSPFKLLDVFLKSAWLGILIDAVTHRRKSRARALQKELTSMLDDEESRMKND